MNDDDDKDARGPSSIHWGDMGALALAGGFSLFGIYLCVDMVLGGHPLAVLFRKAPEQKAAQRPLSDEEVRALPFHAARGETVILTNHPPAAFRVGDPFPEIKSWASLRITLERSLCLGDCPSYAVQIAGDGRVFWRGGQCVAEKGERKARIAPAEVQALVGKFRDAGYFDLKDRYAAAITDQPTYRTSIRFDGRSKSVSDYAGAMAGMPKAVTALEDAIDKAAGTARWIGRRGACVRG
jgi:hypothetical protein